MKSLKSETGNVHISFVIATLGSVCLQKTLTCIQEIKLEDYEILIVSPHQITTFDVKCFRNLNVIISPWKGQVVQRSLGFKNAKGKLVVQLDDDLKFYPVALLRMIKSALILGPRHVIGPVFIDPRKDSRSRPYEASGLRRFFSDFTDYFFLDLPWGIKKFGHYSTVNASRSISPDMFTGALIPTAWLAGGCVISHHCDLIFDNFYPFSGKAYSEDLIHSKIRSSQGIQHWVQRESIVYTATFNPISDVGIQNPVGYLYNFLLRQYRLSRLLGGSFWRIALAQIYWIFYSFTRISATRLRRNQNHTLNE